MKNVHFKEEQRYNDRFLLILMGLFSVAVAAAGVRELLADSVNYANAIFLLLSAVAIGGLVFWYNNLRMKVILSDKKIKFKMSPLHAKKRSLKWKDVEECAVVKTSAAAQWSGGNITFNNEKRFSLNGRNGLAIKTKQGESYFIGCKNVEALQTALDEIEVQTV